MAGGGLGYADPDWTGVGAGIFHDFHHEWISTIKNALKSGLLPPDHDALVEELTAMAIHDWTRVPAGIFHHFHHEWISAIAGVLNHGLLPPDHYALAEQIAGGLGPDVLTLQGPRPASNGCPDPSAGVLLATTPPRARYHARTEPDRYAEKAKAITIRHASNHEVIAVVEIVSPGNKSNRHGLRSFVEKAIELLHGSIHLLIVDLFPPTARDLHGLNKLIWDEIMVNDFALPSDQPLSLGAYISYPIPEAFIEPTAVGAVLIDMPLFLSPDMYVPVPLEATYQSAWEELPAYWRSVLSAPAGS
jgi:hypothetical protein